MDNPLHNPANDPPDDSLNAVHESRHDTTGNVAGDPHQESAQKISSPIPESITAPAAESVLSSSSEFIPDATGELNPELNAESIAPSATPTLEMPVAAADSEYVALPSFSYVGVESPKRRSLRNNLFTLLGLSLASFALTAWVLVRVESPFGMFASGPRDVASAQLRALDHGEMRASYNMFSEQYRKQVTFDQWRQLVVTHWRLFHAEVLSAEPPEQSGQRVTLEIHLRGADEKEYRARFTMIRAQGRWWVDDLHWTEEADDRDLQRT